jgi:hemoglobin
MVRKFYSLVLKDEMLSPYFIKALGSDLDNGKWHDHLITLENFWLHMMVGKKEYFGSPFPAHAFLGPMYRETFERWLKLFKEVIDSMYLPEIADKFYKNANIIAEQLIDFLDIDDEDDD